MRKLLLPLLFSLLFATSALAAPAVVQSNKTYYYAGALTTASQAYGSNNTAANLSAVFGHIDGGSPASTTTTDTRNTYSVGIALESFGKLYGNYSANIGAGANTVTSTCSSNCGQGLAIFEVSGVATSSPVDTSGSTTNVDDPAVTHSPQAGSICFANASANGGNPTLPAGYTSLYTDVNNHYWNVGANTSMTGGSQTDTLTTVGVNVGSLQILCFKVPASAAVKKALLLGAG
jgi:hypothetical protein